MKLLIEIPDEQLYRGVPQGAAGPIFGCSLPAANYIERERSKAREDAIREIRRSILFMTRLVPGEIAVVAEAAQPVAAAEGGAA